MRKTPSFIPIGKRAKAWSMISGASSALPRLVTGYAFQHANRMRRQMRCGGRKVAERIRHETQASHLRERVAGAPGFEPGNAGTKNRCLTAWRRPIAGPGAVMSGCWADSKA